MTQTRWNRQLVRPWARITAVGLGLPMVAGGWGLAQPVPEPAVPIAATSTVMALDTTSTGSPQVVLNGQVRAVSWQQRQQRIGLTEDAAVATLGLELLDAPQVGQQPVRWFSDPQSTPLVLATWMEGGQRFLDIVPLVQSGGGTLDIRGSALHITLPPQRVQAVRQGRDRLVFDLTGPVPWQLAATADGATLTLQAPLAGAVPTLRELTAEGPPPTITESPQGTTLTLPVATSTLPRVTTLPSPPRLVIDLGAPAPPRTIAWADGLTWHQAPITVGNAPQGHTLAAHWLALDLQRLHLRPIWSDPATAVGIAPLVTTARRWQAPAAINGGFFNRNNQSPLGAVRRDDDWISGPILGRGVFAWNDQGDTRFDRLALRQTLTVGGGTLPPTALPLTAINSGYVQAGTALYTPAWGQTYRPFADNEVVVTVVDGQVVAQQRTGAAGSTTVAIPPAGYLLAVRADGRAERLLPPGATVTLESETLPTGFEPFPHIMGGGPLLLKNSALVLNAEAEGFSSAFARQAAIRSAVGRTADGTLLLVTVHPQPGGRGATLADLAQVMAQLGSVDALNLDGGSSSSLVLGGQLVNRPARSAARVQNGLGVFLGPSP